MLVYLDALFERIPSPLSFAIVPSSGTPSIRVPPRMAGVCWVER
mgnify:CR=1 FL=1